MTILTDLNVEVEDFLELDIFNTENLMDDIFDGVSVFALVLHSLKFFAVIAKEECDFGFGAMWGLGLHIGY